MLYAVDLFCGAGGMSEGILQAGFHILFSSDISEDVEKTYVHRHEQLGLIQGKNTYFHRGDIRELNGEMIRSHIQELELFNPLSQDSLPSIDVVFGGPPCQGFSRAGRRSPDDPRNLLFKEYLRVISELTPKYVVMENVEGFNDTKFYGFKGVTGNSYADGKTAPEILLSEFNQIGYNVLKPEVLDASDFGVPQRRKRVIFIAYLKGLTKPKYPYPTHSEQCKVTVESALGDLVRRKSSKNKNGFTMSDYQLQSVAGRTPNIDGKPIHSNGVILNNELSKHQLLIVERFSLFKEGEDGTAVKKRILAQGIDLTKKPHLVADCAKKFNLSSDDVIIRFKSGDVTDGMLDKLLTRKTIRTRLCRNKPSLTVVTLPDDYISPFEDRTFSVREMARLQSFDDSFEFLSKRTTGGPRRKLEVPQYTQVGNAVPPLLAKAIATEIRKVLE